MSGPSSHICSDMNAVRSEICKNGKTNCPYSVPGVKNGVCVFWYLLGRVIDTSIIEKKKNIYIYRCLHFIILLFWETRCNFVVFVFILY